MNDNPAMDRLHKLFEENPVNDQTAGEQEHTGAPDATITQTLSALTLAALSPEAQELLLAVTDSSTTLEPRARRLFVEAGDRANKRRRDDASPLPRLLFLTRNRVHQSVEELADSLSADDGLLRKIERGDVAIEQLGPAGVASWITHLQVPAEAAIEALRASFLATTVDRAAASAKVELNEKQNQFVDEVVRALSET
jgi:hypothetical protein